MLLSAARYFHSVRYLSGRMLAGRLKYVAATTTLRLLHSLGLERLYAAYLDIRAAAATTNPQFIFPWADSPIAILNQPADLTIPVNWNPTDRSLLWRFHLHYFHWAPALASTDPPRVAAIIDDWIAANPPGGAPAWHPYPTSLRLVNWIQALAISRRDAACDARSVETAIFFI